MTILSATGHRPDKPYVFMSVSDQIRANGERHLANAIGYASKSNFQYSDGSMRKALRHFKRADEIDNFFSWPIAQYGVEFTCPPEQVELLKSRMEDSYRVIRESMDRAMFGEGTGGGGLEALVRRRTCRDRFRDFLDRAHNAWLVLTGRADIC